MKRGVLFLLLWHLMLYCRAAAGAETVESLFTKANGLFQKGLGSPGAERGERIREAALLYKRIIEERKIRSGYLYYNLGNCYFHLGEIGKAILNYRRAEKLIPNYSDLKHNLGSARARRKESIQKSQIRSIARTLFFWHYLMSLTTKIVVSSLVFSMIWIILLVKLFWDRPLLRWALGMCIFFAVVVGASGAIECYNDRSVRFGVILAETTVPRKGPGESYAQSFKVPVHEGTEFRLIDREVGWLKIELDSGDAGWVKSGDAELI